MIVPNYWAEGRVRHRANGKQRTMRRFGWSDVSQEAAQAHADQRAAEALAQWLQGARLSSMDRKVAYNGADGLPIREEVVSRHGDDTVVTRNSYGARCLNTARALFVDIDIEANTDPRLARGAVAVSAALTLVAALKLVHLSKGASLALAVGVLVVSGVLAHAFEEQLESWFMARAERRAHRRIRKFIAAHPEWHLRLYETPAGLRALAMHRTFNAGDPDVDECFKALGADPLYARMCRNQRCFRARVTAKPWRMGLTQRLRPRPGVWPVKPKWLPQREAWIAEYERQAAGYAACRFIGALGGGLVDPEVQAVQRLHDSLSRSDSTLPLA